MANFKSDIICVYSVVLKKLFIIFMPSACCGKEVSSFIPNRRTLKNFLFGLIFLYNFLELCVIAAFSAPALIFLQTVSFAIWYPIFFLMLKDIFCCCIYFFVDMFPFIRLSHLCFVLLLLSLLFNIIYYYLQLTIVYASKKKFWKT